MNNSELVSVLEVAVFGLAIAQMLVILLTVRRERDIKDLRELVEEQRLRLTELRAWLAGRTSSQRLAPPESKSDVEPTADAQASKSGMPPQQARSAEDELARATKALEWQHEVAARLKSGISSQQATAPADDGFKWFRDDPNEPPGIAEARRAVNEKTHHPQPRNLPEDTPTQPRTPYFEVERTLTAIRSLKEDTDDSSADLGREPRVKFK